EYVFDEFEILNYESHPAIKAPVAGGVCCVPESGLCRPHVVRELGLWPHISCRFHVFLSPGCVLIQNMAEKSSVFDMIGPVMIGPSSSHTAGVVRIGRVARRLLGTRPEQADITFYNSFARTYEGHGSDRAIIAGLLDYKTDDKRIKDALEIAPRESLSYSFKSVGNASA